MAGINFIDEQEYMPRLSFKTKKIVLNASALLCPYCGTDTLLTLSDGVYCMNDCCDYYLAN